MHTPLCSTHACQLRRQLADEFATAARLYAESVVRLVTSGVSHDDYVRLCERTEEAQNRSEAAFIAFEEHVDLHRCYGDGTCGHNVHNIASGRRRRA